MSYQQPNLHHTAGLSLHQVRSIAIKRDPANPWTILTVTMVSHVGGLPDYPEILHTFDISLFHRYGPLDITVDGDSQ